MSRRNAPREKKDHPSPSLACCASTPMHLPHTAPVRKRREKKEGWPKSCGQSAGGVGNGDCRCRPQVTYNSGGKEFSVDHQWCWDLRHLRHLRSEVVGQASVGHPARNIHAMVSGCTPGHSLSVLVDGRHATLNRHVALKALIGCDRALLRTEVASLLVAICLDISGQNSALCSGQLDRLSVRLLRESSAHPGTRQKIDRMTHLALPAIARACHQCVGIANRAHDLLVPTQMLVVQTLQAD